jgi:hypothetical protein
LIAISGPMPFGSPKVMAILIGPRHSSGAHDRVRHWSGAVL